MAFRNLIRCSLLGFMLLVLYASAGESVASGSTREPIPAYDSPYKNGLYSTIAGINSVRDVRIPGIHDLHLCIPGFNCNVPARVVMQPGEAPLAIVLVGAEGKAIDPLPKQWIAWLSDAGYHVLALNSTLESDFVDRSGRGVSGNLVAEAESVRDIISAFLKSPTAQGRVTRIGVIGMSYGGVEALLLGKMAAEKKLDFQIDAIKSFSPPIDMMRSAELIDRWWREDRWNYTLSELYLKVARHKPVAPGRTIPLSDSLMRAGLAASFRLPLVDIVERNDAAYDLKLLPEAESMDERVRRHDFAATYGFTRFLREAVYPYWKEKSGLKDFSELNADAKLLRLLPIEPSFVEIVVAEDDPLNQRDDFEALKKATTSAKLTILNGGGHVGYINDPWTKAKLLEIFK